MQVDRGRGYRETGRQTQNGSERERERGRERQGERKGERERERERDSGSRLGWFDLSLLALKNLRDNGNV